MNETKFLDSPTMTQVRKRQEIAGMTLRPKRATAVKTTAFRTDLLPTDSGKYQEKAVADFYFELEEPVLFEYDGVKYTTDKCIGFNCYEDFKFCCDNRGIDHDLFDNFIQSAKDKPLDLFVTPVDIHDNYLNVYISFFLIPKTDLESLAPVGGIVKAYRA